MPKENTHIWFARGLLEEVTDRDMFQAISGHLNAYHLGSIIPDTFYYSPDESIENISQVIHGKHGSPTNILILEVMDRAAGEIDISFILGFITHCALDIALHPAINAACGDYYDPDPLTRRKAVYLHRKIETCMDALILNKFRIHHLVRPSLLKNLVFTKIIGSYFEKTERELGSTLTRQILMNRLFTNRIAYTLLSVLCRAGIMRAPEILSLFYSDITRPPFLPDLASPRDLERISAEAGAIIKKIPDARKKALGMMSAAWAYNRGMLSREDLLHEIPGYSLSTGEPPLLDTLRI